MINTLIQCDNCPAIIVFSGYAAEPHNVLLRTQSNQPGWDLGEADGEHLCPECSGYHTSDAGDHAHDIARADEVERP